MFWRNTLSPASAMFGQTPRALKVETMLVLYSTSNLTATSGHPKKSPILTFKGLLSSDFFF
jgi:hypothetical protein